MAQEARQRPHRSIPQEQQTPALRGRQKTQTLQNRWIIERTTPGSVSSEDLPSGMSTSSPPTESSSISHAYGSRSENVYETRYRGELM